MIKANFLTLSKVMRFKMCVGWLCILAVTSGSWVDLRLGAAIKISWSLAAIAIRVLRRLAAIMLMAVVTVVSAVMWTVSLVARGPVARFS